jgi:hypothetical protein
MDENEIVVRWLHVRCRPSIGDGRDSHNDFRHGSSPDAPLVKHPVFFVIVFLAAWAGGAFVDQSGRPESFSLVCSGNVPTARAVEESKQVRVAVKEMEPCLSLK